MRPVSTLSLLLLQASLFICALVDIVPPKIDPETVPSEFNPGESEGGESSGISGTQGGSTGTPSGESGIEGGSSLGGFVSGTDGTSSIGGTEESNNVEDIGEALSSVVDAITSILSALSPSSSTDISGVSFSTATIDEATITRIVAIPTAALACFNASSVYNSCSAQQSGFLLAAESIQAECLCYQATGSSTSWLPYLSVCNQYVQTASNRSAATSGISQGAALCSSAQAASIPITAVATSSLQVTSSSVAAQNWRSVSSLFVLGIFWSSWALA